MVTDVPPGAAAPCQPAHVARAGLARGRWGLCCSRLMDATPGQENSAGSTRAAFGPLRARGSRTPRDTTGVQLSNPHVQLPLRLRKLLTTAQSSPPHRYTRCPAAFVGV